MLQCSKYKIFKVLGHIAILESIVKGINATLSRQYLDTPTKPFISFMMGNMYSGPMKQRSPKSESSVSARVVSSNFAPGQPQIIVDASIWAMFTVSTLFITLRFYCRFVRSGRLLPDDYVLAAAWVCMLASASLLTKLMSLGFMDTSFNSDQIILFLRSSQSKCQPLTILDHE